MLFDVVPMAWDLPVCVNFHEASAFALWKTKKSNKNYRVSSELEHHAIRDSSQQLSGDSVDMVLRGPAYGKMMTEVSSSAVCFSRYSRLQVTTGSQKMLSLMAPSPYDIAFLS
jgi:hypothetical protein